MDLEFRHLRNLCAVADAGSLNRAAAGLGLPQPALSRQVRRVEGLLGGALFERDTAGVRPTGLGTTVLGHAETVLKLLDDTTGQLRAQREEQRSVLRVGWTTSVLSSALMGWLRDNGLGEQVQFVTAGTSTELADMLQNGELDAAVRSEDPEYPYPCGAGVGELTVAQTSTMVAVAARHPLAARESVTMADLAKQEWISASGCDNCMEFLRNVCGPYGFDPRITYDVPVLGPRADVIRRQGCVSLVQSSHPPGLGVRHLPVTDLRGPILHSLAFRKESSLARHVPVLAGVLTQACEELAGIHPLTAPARSG